jgi:hypothetical protein
VKTLGGVFWNEIIILPPGKHTLDVQYAEYESGYGITAGASLSGELYPGYHVLLTEVNGRTVNFEISDIKNYSALPVFSRYPNYQMIPVETIIEGMNVKIATKFKGFTGGR